MDNKNNKKTSNIFWSKPEREKRSRPSSATSISTSSKLNNLKSSKNIDKLNVLPIESTINIKSINEDFLKSSFLPENQCIEASPSTKISIKDLCSEDKARIANLVKELAKRDAEKDDIKKVLENERQVYENKIKEMYEQHEKLLKEKEMLMVNFGEKQKKLEKLFHKKEKKNSKINVNSNDKVNKIENENINNKLLSTPRSRSISPILIVNEKQIDYKNDDDYVKAAKKNYTKQIDMEIVKLKGKPLLNSTIINNNQNINEEIIKNDLIKIDDNNTKNDNHKKEHLIKEKIDLINEQKMLQDLINHHQSLIKKNQEQIMLQQKLHREKLEQLKSNDSQQTPQINPLKQNLIYVNKNSQSASLPLNDQLVELNRKFQTQNINNSIKLKQENSFDIFDLIGDNNNNNQNNVRTINQRDNTHYSKKQINYYIDNSSSSLTTTTAIDEDEKKLFEEIFFVN